MSSVSARHTHGILKSVTARFTGKAERGPDHSDDPAARVPHRDSYDVDDPRAKRWSRIGDGSVGQGIAYREALIETAEEVYHQGWKTHPSVQVRADRAREAALAAELETLGAASPADVPIGRPAAIRTELTKIRTRLAEADRRLRRIDVTVLKALLGFLDYATGRLFPSHETIAAKAGCSVSAVKAAKRRLRAHGLLEWVRRTIRTGTKGEAGPQREQTSCAYHFDHAARMARTTWQRYQQILDRKLRRLGRIPAAIARAVAPPPIGAAAPPGSLMEAVASLGASIHSVRT